MTHVRHENRLRRSRVKRAVKQRLKRCEHYKSTDGIECPHCEPHRNGLMQRATSAARDALRQMTS